MSMQEYLTEAIILDKEGTGEFDARVSFYTKELGKVIAKATSARKITSKLNAHLEPPRLSLIRLVHKNNFQIVDALTIDNFTNWRRSATLVPALDLLRFVNEMTLEGQNDYQLWSYIKNAMKTANFNYISLLKILGFDPRFAQCEICQRKPNLFSASDLMYYCSNCAPQKCLNFSILS